MKIALVHDYLLEYGGAERALRVLADMYPDAPIYTSFVRRGSPGGRAFSDREVKESKWGWLLKRGRLYSPLRFLLPWVWRSIDLSEYDLVITSCSGYIARGFKVGEDTKVIAYCHTPPRFLYGYRTSIDWRKYWWARLYGLLVNTPLRVFDYESAQEVDEWLVNSENVGERVRKFYRKEARVVYPPVEVERFVRGSEGVEKEDYHLIVSRLVGGKGLEGAVEIAGELGLNLRVVGASYGYSKVRKKLKKKEGEGEVEFLGRVSDKELVRQYAGAESFWAFARDEDFGMTVVEAMASGIPVVAYKGGGFKESVVEGETGVFVREVSKKSVGEAVEKIGKKDWEKKKLQEQARKFLKERFIGKLREVVENA